MEYNLFRDYCKAENSDDEENNRSLQSRLYAEIYYASNTMDHVDRKTNVKLETSSTNTKECHADYNINIASNSNEDHTNKTVNKIDNRICENNVSKLVDEDDKSKVTFICANHDVENVHVATKNKSNLTEPYIKMSQQHPQESIQLSQSNVHIVTCKKIEITESNPDSQTAHNTSKNILVKLETDVESEQRLEFVEPLNPETSMSTIQSPSPNSTKRNIDNNIEKIQEVECTDTNVNNTCNIFKKYEFSKLFINKLYLEKYENLEKRLQEVEEENKKSLRESEQKIISIEQDEENQQLLDKYRCPISQTNADTRYAILSTDEKIQNTSDSEEITLLSSDTQSDSDESILEVPIPPKPQPPVINLQDSDESSETSSDGSDMDQNYSFVLGNENSLIKQTDTVFYGNEKDSDTDSEGVGPINNTMLSHMTGDIMLNCTEVQKGASNIKEIVEMSKHAQTEKCSNKSQNDSDKNKSIILSELNNKNLNKPDKTLLCMNDKDNASEIHLPLESISKSSVVYERDKNMSIDFTEDVLVTNFHHDSSQTNSSRKRQHEINEEPCSSAKLRKKEDNENTQTETNLKQQNKKDKNKDKQESWEEYFFRPMSDNLKVFYNEPRGQENYDVPEIQSTMSKDPRLWAILDEDLMPNLSRRRFWNVKCNNCNHEGHQKYNCPEPRKPPQCHMCGTQGHVETRCPQKMCLTCGKRQGTFRKTCESCRTLYCNMCKAIGHESTECPDLWRRFHQTTQNTEINIPENLSEVMKPADLLYCCNCAKRGHDSTTCNEYRWSLHFPTPAFVSNYTDGPGCENSESVKNTTSVGYIPLLKKTRVTRRHVFRPGQDDLQGYTILYSYGSFYTKKAVGEQILTKLSNDTLPDMTNFLQGRIFPSFVDELTKLIKFEIKILSDSDKKLILMRIRSAASFTVRVCQIFTIWLSLHDEDKLIKLHVKLPRDTKQMMKLLIDKCEELDTDRQDPRFLCGQIEKLKIQMARVRDQTKLYNISQKILKHQQNLVKIYYTTPNIPNVYGRVRSLQKIIRRLQKYKHNNVLLPLYLRIIVLYNSIFLPRRLSDKELQILFEKYYDKGKGNQQKKQQNKSNPYDKFLENLRKLNKSAINAEPKKIRANQSSNTAQTGIQDRQISPDASTTIDSSKNVNINNSTSQLSKDTQKEDKQMPMIVSASIAGSSKANNIQSNNNVTKPNIENSNRRDNEDQNTTELSNNHVVDTIQVPCNQCIPSNSQMTNTSTKNNSKSASSHLATISPQKSLNTSSKYSKNNQVNSDTVSSIGEKGFEDNVESVTDNSSETVQTSNSQQEDSIVNSETSSTKKKKSKKAKKAKLDLENNSEHKKKTITSVNPSIESKAVAIINEALEFNIPYMNKAVGEVKKRINDKSIKQEHIDVLQKLINLEKDHQKHVISFCNYLK